MSISALIALTACGHSSTPRASQTSEQPALARVSLIQTALTSWAHASTLAEAKAGAEAARNLITGPDVSGYGDADGDGHIDGSTTTGLLPGDKGQAGLVGTPTTSCIEANVLGGSFSDAAARWADVTTRIAEWTTTNNTFPGLRSQPQRIVGWASLTLATSDLAAAKEYAGHAQMHLDVSRKALQGC
jgi:hypothetical protein